MATIQEFSKAIIRLRIIRTCIFQSIVCLLLGMSMQILCMTRSWSSLIGLCLFILTGVAYPILQGPIYQVAAVEDLKGWDLVMSCFSPRHLIVMIVWVMVEGLSSLAVLLLLGQPLMCSHNNCQEKTQLLMTFAILQGIWHSGNHLVHQRNHLGFSLCQQPLLLRLQLRQCLLNSMVDSFKITATFTAIVFCFGNVLQLVSLQIPYDLYFTVTIFGTAFSIKMVQQIGFAAFSHFLTKPLEFPVEPMFAVNRGNTLHLALQQDHSPLIKYLAFLDTSRLAIHSAARRQQVYALNNAGKPENWINISTSLLQVIECTTHRLTDAQSSKMTPLEGPHPSSEGPHPSSEGPHPSSEGPHPSSEGSQTLLGFKEPQQSSTSSQMTFEPTTVTYMEMKESKMRLWSSPSIPHKSVPPKSSNGPRTLITDLQKMAAKLKVFTDLRYFDNLFSQLIPEVKKEYSLKDYKCVIWAIEALSELASASYSEDKYGGVQKDLAVIMQSFRNLSKALDSKACVPLSHLNSHHMQVTHALQSAATLAINKLTMTFGDHTQVFQLPLQTFD